MIYLGKSVHLSHDLFDYRDEIKIYQQHCGGENVCVYKGKLLEGGEPADKQERILILANSYFIWINCGSGSNIISAKLSLVMRVQGLIYQLPQTKSRFTVS